MINKNEIRSLTLITAMDSWIAGSLRFMKEIGRALCLIRVYQKLRFSITSIGLIVLLLSMSPLSCIDALYFGNSLTIDSSEYGTFVSPRLESGGGNVYVVWDDKDNVYFRSVKQNGSEFGGTIILGKSISSSGGPQISATESGNVYVVWAETNNTSGESRIVFRGSANHGDNFGRKVLHTYSDPNLDPSPQISATESGNVYVVWRSDGLHFMEIGDRGKLFAGRIVLSDYVSEFHDPLVTETKSGVFYLLWIDKVPTSELVKLSLKRVSEFYIPRSQ